MIDMQPIQLELPNVSLGHNVRAARALSRLGCQQWWCTACGVSGSHTTQQCNAMRPVCEVDGCFKKTCIQARCSTGHAFCLDHFFGSDEFYKRFKVT